VIPLLGSVPSYRQATDKRNSEERRLESKQVSEWIKNSKSETGGAPRASQCLACHLRGAEGSGNEMYWYRNMGTGEICLINGATGISHNQTCERASGQRQYHGIRVDLNDGINNVLPGWYAEKLGKRMGDGSPETKQEIRHEERDETARNNNDRAEIHSNGDAQLWDLLREKLGNSVDAKQVAKIVDERLATFQPAATTVQIRERNSSVRDMGIQHRIFLEVLEDLQLGLNVWMVGPAGTGKTSIAHAAAKAMGLAFDSVSCTVRMPESRIVGFIDANGIVRDTGFKKVWALCKQCGYEEDGKTAKHCEHGYNGGVFLWDECDNGDPNSQGIVNEALANGQMSFPDGRYDKHPNAYICAAANTYGLGADRLYVGRMQLDAAFLDRFGSYIEVEIDEALEDAAALANIEDKDLGRRWIAIVRAVRSNLYAAKTIRATVSPRASINGCIMLQGGQDVKRVVAKTLRKGISEQDWQRLSEGVSFSL